MARMGIRYEHVAAAAQALAEAGEVPTIDRVRASLGTGSKTTITRHLKAWRLARQHLATTAAEPTVPPDVGELPPIAVASLGQLWSELQAQAAKSISAMEHRLACERERMAQRLRAERRRRRLAASAAQRGEVEITALRKHLAKQGQALQVVQQQRNAERTRAHDLTSALQIIERQTQVLIARLDRGLSEFRSELAATRRQFDDVLAAERASWQADRAKWRDDIAKLQAQSFQAQADWRQRVAEIQSAHEQAQLARETHWAEQAEAYRFALADRDHRIERLERRLLVSRGVAMRVTQRVEAIAAALGAENALRMHLMGMLVEQRQVLDKIDAHLARRSDIDNETAGADQDKQG